MRSVWRILIMQRLYVIKKEELLGHSKSNQVDKSSGPDRNYPRLFREARENCVEASMKIYVSFPVTG